MYFTTPCLLHVSNRSEEIWIWYNRPSPNPAGTNQCKESPNKCWIIMWAYVPPLSCPTHAPIYCVCNHIPSVHLLVWVFGGVDVYGCLCVALCGCVCVFVCVDIWISWYVCPVGCQHWTLPYTSQILPPPILVDGWVKNGPPSIDIVDKPGQNPSVEERGYSQKKRRKKSNFPN